MVPGIFYERPDIDLAVCGDDQDCISANYLRVAEYALECTSKLDAIADWTKKNPRQSQGPAS